MYVYIRVCMHVSMYLCIYLCSLVYINMYECIYVSMHVSMYYCVLFLVYVCMYVYMCMYVFVVTADLKLSTSDQASSQSDRSQSIPLPEKDHRFLQEGGGRYPVV